MPCVRIRPNKKMKLFASFSPLLLLLITIPAGLLGNIARNHYSKRHGKNQADFFLFNLLSGLFTLAVLLASGGLQAPSLYTLTLGLLFGAATAACMVLGLMALRTGPMAYTTVMIASSMIIPAFSGAVFWGERISPWQYAGVALLVASWLFALDNRQENRRASLKWLLYCMGAFVGCGLIGVLQKVHQNSAYKGELNSFLALAFAVSALVSLLAFLLVRRRKTVMPSPLGGKVWALMAVSGITVGIANLLNMILVGKMASVIFFPVVNGANVALSALAGVVLFGERLTRRQWIGLLLGAASILLLCNVL